MHLLIVAKDEFLGSDVHISRILSNQLFSSSHYNEFRPLHNVIMVAQSYNLLIHCSYIFDFSPNHTRLILILCFAKPF